MATGRLGRTIMRSGVGRDVNKLSCGGKKYACGGKMKTKTKKKKC